jgi:hypothetical protein
MPRKIENVERYAILLHQANKRRTAVLESKYYGRGGDPANHVEFESELKRQAAAKAKKSKRNKMGVK